MTHPHGDRDDFLRTVLERIAGLPDAIRQAISDHQWAEIPLTVFEWAYALSAPPATVLTPQRQMDGLIEVNAIVVSMVAASSCRLQLGAMTFPVAAGDGKPTVIAPVRLLLGSSDTRTMTIIGGGTGEAGFFLCGQQRPTFGVLTR